jgi:hypothetical protein
MDVLT